MKNREIMAHGKLETIRDELKHYRFYASMLVRSTHRRAREILTDYELYAKMIPYVQSAELDKKTNTLKLVGGIWKFVLQSTVVFEERSDNWIFFRIVDGHFKGMTGHVLFEPKGDQGTLVYLGGDVKGTAWPPAFVIERGAEIVFGVTGRRMRSYIESNQEPKAREQGESSNDPEVPQPRSRL